MLEEKECSEVINIIKNKFKKVMDESFKVIQEDLNHSIFIINEEDSILKKHGHRVVGLLNGKDKILKEILQIKEKKQDVILEKLTAHSNIGHYLIVIKWEKTNIDDKYILTVINKVVKCIISECKKHIELDLDGYRKHNHNLENINMDYLEENLDEYKNYCEEYYKFAEYNKEIMKTLTMYCEYKLTGKEKTESEQCNTIDYLNDISKTPYENSYSKGKLAIFDSNSEIIKFFNNKKRDENGQDKIEESIVKFKKYEYLKDSKGARKLVEMSSDEYLTISDGIKIYGMIPKDLHPPRATVKFIGNYSYEIELSGGKVIGIEYGYPYGKNDLSDRDLKKRIKVVFDNEITDEDIKNLLKIINEIKKQSKGSMLVISNKAKEEAERLKYQSTLIETKSLHYDPNIVKNISKIDGSILIDTKGNCEAIGVILDGIACPIGDRSRGARYNSAIKYINGQINNKKSEQKNTDEDKHMCMAIVISEDGIVDIIDKKEIDILKDRTEKLDNHKQLEEEKISYSNDIEKYSNNINLEQDNPENYIERGNTYRNIGKYEEAIKDYTKAIELETKNTRVYEFRADTYYKLRKFEEAINDCNTLIELDGDKAKYYKAMGIVYSRIEKYEEAIEAYSKAIKLDESNDSYYNQRGNAYSRIEKYEEAIKDYSKAIELDKKNSIYYYNRGIVYSRIEKYEEAENDYSKAIELDEKNDRYYNNRGNVYEKIGKYEEAENDYNKAIELDGDNSSYYYNRGIVYSRIEKYEEAIKDYSKAIELDEKNDKYYNNRGNAYKNIEKYEEAIKDYSKAIELDEKNDRYYNNRGNAYKNIEKYEEAIKDYSKAIELDEKNDIYYNNRGNAYEKIGKYEEAENDYNKAIELKK